MYGYQAASPGLVQAQAAGRARESRRRGDSQPPDARARRDATNDRAGNGEYPTDHRSDTQRRRPGAARRGPGRAPRRSRRPRRADLQALAGPSPDPTAARCSSTASPAAACLPRNPSARSASTRIPSPPNTTARLRPHRDLHQTRHRQIPRNGAFFISDDVFNSRNPYSAEGALPEQLRREPERPYHPQTSFFLDIEKRDTDENAVVNAPSWIRTSTALVPASHRDAAPPHDRQPARRLPAVHQHHADGALHLYDERTASRASAISRCRRRHHVGQHAADRAAHRNLRDELQSRERNAFPVSAQP